MTKSQRYEGVPGDGTPTLASITGWATLSPSMGMGMHYYYAKITRDDGKLLGEPPFGPSALPGRRDLQRKLRYTLTGHSFLCSPQGVDPIQFGAWGGVLATSLVLDALYKA